MTQKQYSPLKTGELAFTLFAANEGFIDDVSENDVVKFEDALLAHVNGNNKALMDEINDSGDFNDDIAAKMKAAIEDFKSTGTY